MKKLRYEHIHLTGFSKMRVDLAAQVLPIILSLFAMMLEMFSVKSVNWYLYSCQVLSESVCTAMYFTNDPEMVETRRFVCMFDRFFDCMNVSNFVNGKHKRKVFQQPYRSSGDFRLKVYL